MTVFAPESDLLFVGRYYESRVVAVDVSTFEPIRYFRTGLGTRALAVVPEKNLLLAASVYDGTIRAYNMQTGTLLVALPVGGHVKSIAVDHAGRYAYFGSQCGLLRLDVEQWLAQAR